MLAMRTLMAGLLSLVLVGTISIPAVADTAAGSATHEVATDGSGDFRTIGQAIGAAAEGDTILVGPGAYTEAIVIGKALTLKGNGPREQILLIHPEAAPTAGAVPDAPGGPYSVIVRDADVTLTGLTISAPRGGGSVFLSGGSSLVHGNTLGALVRVSGAAEAEISFNTLLDFADVLVVDSASALVEDNDFRGGSVRVDGSQDVTVHDNIIRALAPVVGESGVDVRGPGANATIEDNVISGSGIGISVADGASAFIEGNELRDNGIGIAWFAWQRGSIAANSVCGASVDVWVAEGSEVEVTDAQTCQDEPAG
jgi:parallel beta-helix repeat protein